MRLSVWLVRSIGLVLVTGVTMMSAQAAEDGKRREALAELAKASSVILVGKVKSVGESPARWSGRVPAFQPVTYEVDRYLKGNGPAELVVQHVLVKGSPTAQPGDEPKLSTKLFAAGKVLLVFAEQTDDKQYVAYDERHGSQPAAPATIAEVEALLAK